MTGINSNTAIFYNMLYIIINMYMYTGYSILDGTLEVSGERKEK